MTRTAFIQTLFSGGAGIAFEAPSIAGDIDPEPFPRGRMRGRFRCWKERPMVPVVESRNRLVRLVLGAADEGRAIRIRYRGGSEPGLDREISPAFVFTRPQQSDLSAWYESRGDMVSGRGAELVAGPGNGARDLSRFLEARCPVYVLAWCHQRTSQRYFRISRMDLV